MFFLFIYKIDDRCFMYGERHVAVYHSVTARRILSRTARLPAQVFWKLVNCDKKCKNLCSIQ